MRRVHVVGAGLAGAEATYQLVRRGVPVLLHEMRPKVTSPAHHTDLFAELVCSNSLRANNIENAVGLLKEEMRRLDSLIMQAAERAQVPAGGALAVDRTVFAQFITTFLKQHPLVTVVTEEVTGTDFGEDYVIFASGPLTSPQLSQAIGRLVQQDYFHFYDAAAPIVEADSLDYNVIYKASRYDKGEAAYLNCPFTQEEYLRFYEALVGAEVAPVHEVDKEQYFEACMPIEVMAKRGVDTMRFGPLKPVGLPDPRTGEEPYAVVQLRQDNGAATLYNLVGFQTHLKWGEQKRVFSLIPGLAQAQIVRYGVMHRNSYLNSPLLLNADYSLRGRENIYFAGQMTGVEGYVESAASGLVAGRAVAARVLGMPYEYFPVETAHGALAHYISNPAVTNFQPMNINFGLLPPFKPPRRMKKKEKYALVAERALKSLEEYEGNEGLLRRKA